MSISVSPVNFSDGRFHLSFWTLCVAIFFAGVFARPDTVLALEQIFIIFYIVLLRALPSLLRMIKQHWVISVITLLWIISITISFFNSPFDLLHEDMALRRYIQTLTHVAFFLCVRDYVGRYPVSLKWILFAIPMACISVMVVMIVILLGEDLSLPETSARWLLHPPLNLHIRHTGYLIAAGIGITIGFCFLPDSKPRERAAVVLLLTTLFTFLFWTGGRGATLSTLFAFVVIWGAAQWKGNSTRFLCIAFAISIIAGAVLSELLAVFPWNGVMHMVFRTANSQDLNQLGSGRIEIWLSTWATIKDYPLFGLGSHGYVFMPNHIFGLHPHSFVLQFLIEWGAAGTLLIMTVLTIGFFKGLRTLVINKQKELSPITVAIGGLILSLGFHGLFDGTFFYPQPTLYLVMALAIWTVPGYAVPPELRSR